MRLQAAFTYWLALRSELDDIPVIVEQQGGVHERFSELLTFVVTT